MVNQEVVKENTKGVDVERFGGRREYDVCREFG